MKSKLQIKVVFTVQRCVLILNVKTALNKANVTSDDIHDLSTGRQQITTGKTSMLIFINFLKRIACNSKGKLTCFCCFYTKNLKYITIS